MDNYPENLRPKVDASGREKEPFDQWWKRAQGQFKAVPENVAQYWLHEHWGNSPYSYLRSADYQFDKVTWQAERLFDVLSTWNRYNSDQKECVSHGHRLVDDWEYKLLSIPLLLAQFSRSGRGHRVLIGFLVSCSALLALSFASAVWPPIAWWRLGNPGVPVKDQIAQSAEFVICAFCLLYVSAIEWRAGRHTYSAIALASSLLFLADVLFVATSRTELVVIASLLLVFLVKERGWKWLPLGLLMVAALASVVWVSSSYIRGRVAHGVWELKQYELVDQPTSIGLRLEWWRKSLGFIEQAPILGNGTGSLPKLFRESAQNQTGASGVAATNPHNQIFAIAISLGLLGTAILFSMWIAHTMLFREGISFGWFGLVVVIQNMIGCIFNSHLFDFAEGWTYVWGVGVIGGLVLREKAAAATVRDQPVPQFGSEAKVERLHQGISSVTP